MADLRAWARDHALAVDCGIALVLFGLGLLSVRVDYDIGTSAPHNFRFATGIALVTLLTIPLALRRRLPPVPMVCVTLAITGYTIWGVSQDLLGAAALVAVYSVAAYSPPRVSAWILTVCMAVILGNLLWILLVRSIDVTHDKVSVLGAGLLSFGENFFVLIAFWLMGYVARRSRLRAAALAERNAELQTAQEMIAEQAVLDERVRIAREVHDVVAHHVSVMGIQAGAARRVMVRSPDQATELLTAIEESSRHGVAELQQLLRFLRSETGGTARETAPPPTLSRLGALVLQVNEAGLRVSTAVEGTPRPLPASLDLSAYRVAQEAMTNALKHGGAGTRVKVTLRYTVDCLELSVVDDGRGQSHRRGAEEAPVQVGPGGHGLVGMRERAALHGGRFEAYRPTEGGFAVHATFPLPPAYRAAS